MVSGFLEKVLGEDPGNAQFQAQPWYNRYGDCVVFHSSEEEGYAERVDDLLTLYRAVEDDRVVGFQVKGVASIIRRFQLESMKIEARTQDGEVKEVSITALLMGAAFSSPGQPTPRRRYGYMQAADLVSRGMTVRIAA
jgi:hypothetical protein